MRNHKRKRWNYLFKLLILTIFIILYEPKSYVKASEIIQDPPSETTDTVTNPESALDDTFTIHFVNEQVEVTNLKVASGGTITYENLPEVPLKKGYHGTWYFQDKMLENSIQNITENLTIEVRWQPNQYQLTFQVNGGNKLSEDQNSLQVTYDSTYGKLPTPTRRGYEFQGWFTKRKAGTKVEADSLVSLTKDTTLYAHWITVLPDTLANMESIDYYIDSMTGLSHKKLSISAIRSLLRPFGTFFGKGMPLSQYRNAMKNTWIDRTDYNNEPENLSIDITKTMNYNSYVNYLKNLSRYDGVYLYEIGKSTEGRPLYSIEVDVDSDYDKKVICLTGQTHTREFAGGVFIVKQLYELVQKAQTDEATMEMLKHYKFAAVPIISLDVREGIILNAKKWTSSGGELWKAYANGTDGNRNYPGLQMGQIYRMYTKKSTISNRPGFGFYPGDYSGSCNETQAMMKWFYHYVVVEQAIYHLDYHQQGSIIYAGKPWQTTKQINRCIDLADGISSVLNKGNNRKYTYVPEASSYGLRGEGSTASDFAISLSVGAKFSPAYGFYVFPTKAKEYPLIQIRNLSTTKIAVKDANPNFASATLEIGNSPQALGNSANARSILAKEYQNYHFGSLLESLPKLWEKSHN